MANAPLKPQNVGDVTTSLHIVNKPFGRFAKISEHPVMGLSRGRRIIA
jgi:hypothetical protein